MTNMKKLFILANWKSNKTVTEAEEWIKEFGESRSQSQIAFENLEIILCPPFTLLYPLKTMIYYLSSIIKLGAQDISPFPNGAYTGEVSACMLKDLGVKYALIGHSERRNYFQESGKIIENKIKETLNFGLIPILGVQDKATPVPEGVKILLYEPARAIGSGVPESPEKVNETARTLKENFTKGSLILYGGSVTSQNAANFCRQQNLDGIGAGGASLDSKSFFEIVKNVSQI